MENDEREYQETEWNETYREMRRVPRRRQTRKRQEGGTAYVDYPEKESKDDDKNDNGRDEGLNPLIAVLDNRTKRRFFFAALIRAGILPQGYFPRSSQL